MKRIFGLTSVPAPRWSYNRAPGVSTWVTLPWLGGMAYFFSTPTSQVFQGPVDIQFRLGIPKGFDFLPTLTGVDSKYTVLSLDL